MTRGSLVGEMAAGEHRSQDPTATTGTPESNLSTTIVAALRAGGSRSRPVVIDDAGSWTVDQLHGAVSRAAGALRACGVARGDRVVVALTPGRAWLQAFLGAVHLGAIAVPIDPNDHGSGLAVLLDDLDPSLVVAEDDRRWPAARIGLADLDRRAPIPAVAVAPGDCAFVIATSGTTGRAKGVMHAHGPSSAPGYVCKRARRRRSATGCCPRPRGSAPWGSSSGSCGRSRRGRASSVRAAADGAGDRHDPPRRGRDCPVRGAHVLGAAGGVPGAPSRACRCRREAQPAQSRRASHCRPRSPCASGTWPASSSLDGYGSAECGDIVIGHRQGRDTRRVGASLARESRCGSSVDGPARRVWPRRVACSFAAQTATLGYWGRPDESARASRRRVVRSGDVARRCARRSPPRGARGRGREGRRPLAAAWGCRGVPV